MVIREHRCVTNCKEKSPVAQSSMGLSLYKATVAATTNWVRKIRRARKSQVPWTGITESETAKMAKRKYQHTVQVNQATTDNVEQDTSKVA